MRNYVLRIYGQLQIGASSVLLIQFNAIPEMNILFTTSKQYRERKQICPHQESLNIYIYQVNGYKNSNANEVCTQ